MPRLRRCAKGDVVFDIARWLRALLYAPRVYARGPRDMKELYIEGMLEVRDWLLGTGLGTLSASRD